jgi:isoquinoline 1-oxidoreductase beta subunit
MAEIFKIDRRDFIGVVGTAAGGLILGVHLPFPSETPGPAPAPETGEFKPNVFIAVVPDGHVIMTTPRPEMGQGSRTGFKMIVADELEVPWDAMEIRMALAGPREIWGSMTAGGSTSIRLFFGPLGDAAAAGREMLVAAAAERWGVAAADCTAQLGTVLHAASGRSLKYGELTDDAAKQRVPAHPRRKQPSEYRYIGKERPRVDVPEKVDGSAVYGLDFRRPGMKFAVVRRPPVIGGSLTSWDDAETKSVRGVRQVVRITAGVAVVADNTWAALKGMDRLKVDWDPGPNAGLSSAAIAAQLERDGQAEPLVAEETNSARNVFATAARKISAVYECPFLSHSPLEPINATAEVSGNTADVWVPTQAPQAAQATAAQALRFPVANIRVHTLYSGGGFGRRLENDWVADAVEVSRAIGSPVQIMWTREEDTTHGRYRPISRHQMEAAFDASGRWLGWRHRVIAHSNAFASDPERGRNQFDRGALSGAAGLAYKWPAALIEWKMSNTPLNCAAFRSVYAQQNCFATEAFLDEIAHELKRDPLELRLELLEGSDPRQAALLRRVAEEIGWGKRPAEGHGLGLAVTYCFGGRAAHAVEASVERSGKIRVHRVESAIDCGLAVYPDGVRQQAEGGVIMALTGALYSQITVANGQVQQRTFADYPLVAMDEAPPVNVHIVDGGEPIGGVGEPPIPPLAPALSNAVFAATGKRLRRMPFGRVEL